jgi:ribulose kinase
MVLEYLAIIQGIALGTRHIIDVMNDSGYDIDTIMACGGTKNSVFLQEHANATGCMILLPEEIEAILLGSAMLGSVAAAFYSDIPDAMNWISKSVTPQTEKVKHFYDAKYKIFHKMYEDDAQYKRVMRAF